MSVGTRSANACSIRSASSRAEKGSNRGGHSAVGITPTVYARGPRGPPCATVGNVAGRSRDTPPEVGTDGHRTAPAEALLADLAAAFEAATDLAGAEPLGVRGVEWAPGARGYLCAFSGGSFACLAADLVPVRDPERAREIAGAALLWEHLEAAVDPESLLALVRAIGSALVVLSDPPELLRSLEDVADRTLELVRWRGAPERELASLVQVDRATELQARVHAAYGLFVRASDPLVEIQERLDSEVVETLRSIEQAAALARVGERLSEILSDALPECARDADSVLAAHHTPLDA